MSESQVNIVVASRLSGAASGQVRVTTSLDETAVNLIVAFCNEKGLRNPGSYVLRTTSDLMMDNKRPLSSYNLADGDVVFLTNRSSGDPPLGWGSWLIMAGIALIIALCGLVAVGLIYRTTGDIADDYGIVFDAGSTHTTMLLYRWGGAKLNDTGTPQQIHKCEMKGGGISMFVGREDKLEDALKTCLNEAKSVIPGGKVSTTPVFLGATGGMRILNMQNPSAVENLMNIVAQTFSKSGFEFQEGFSKIISGYTEGADAWVTSNYLTNVFTSKQSINFTLGTLDLGGASTQWAYQVKKNGTVDLELYGHPHSILTNSSLCFGRFQSLIRYTAQLTVGLTDSTENITDPCLPSGFHMKISLKDIFSSPCAQMDSNLRPKLPETTNITIVGSSSSDNCSKQVASLFNQSECMDYYKYPLCFAPQNLSETYMPYLAISGFYGVMNSLNLTAPCTLQRFIDAVDAVCQKTWQKVKILRSSRSSSSSATENICYVGHYVQHLLTTGYSFNNVTWRNLNFIDSIDGTELGWTLGLMINVTNSIAAELPAEPLKPVIFGILIVTFLIFIMLSVIFTYHAWKSREQPSSYQRLSQYGAI